MKVRWELRSLSALASGRGVLRIPINCWRLTVNFNPFITKCLLDGLDFTEDARLGPVPPSAAGMVQFVVGGVIFDGRPVNINQTLQVSIPGGVAPAGTLTFEYLSDE